MAANIDRIYTVRAGDSLSKIARAFYGNSTLYPLIAEANQLNPQGILLIGQTLHIPPKPEQVQEVQMTVQRLPETQMPASPGGSVPQVHDGQVVETVTTTASVWWKDWKYWAAIAAVGGLVWYLTRRRK